MSEIIDIDSSTSSLSSSSNSQLKDITNHAIADLKEIKSEPANYENLMESKLLEDTKPIDISEKVDFKIEYAHDENTIHVDNTVYAKEKESFDALVQQVLKVEKHFKELVNSNARKADLRKVKKDLVKLNARLTTLSQFIDSLRIGEEEPSGTEENNKVPCWGSLFSGINRHRHNAGGSEAEFYNHKNNIISGLKTLYEPEGRPLDSSEFAAQPQVLLVKLLKHQETGLKWLLWRETQKICGGILADDMGLGKTVSMIALMLVTKEQIQKQKPVAKNDKNSKKAWQQQLQIFKNKVLSQKRFSIFDSDSGEESDVSPPKMPRMCYTAQSPDSESEDDDEDELLLPGRQRKSAGTLVVCPMSVMSQWAAEASNKVASNVIKVFIYHGTDRRKVSLSSFRSNDLIITSYSTVVSEWKNTGSDSWLFSLDWQRLILDEAHVIRNAKTATCQSVSSINARCRWALTGTPIQNRALDAFALLSFLKVPNFTDLNKWRKYLNEGMEGHRRMSFIIKPLMLRRTKLQLQASGDMPPLPPLQMNVVEVQLTTAEMAVYKILSAISIKLFAQYLRQREHQNKDLNYYSNETRPSFLNCEIEQRHEEIYRKFLRSLGYNPGEKIQGIVILVLLLRLRQFCCHPGLMVKMLSNVESYYAGNSFKTSVPDELNTDLLAELTSHDEKHEILDSDENLNINLLCEDGQELIKADENDIKPEPPESISETIDLELAQKILHPSNPIFELTRRSAKLQQVYATLHQLLEETNDKIIVVSQWISFLHIIKTHLETIGQEVLEFNGTMNADERNVTLQEFNDKTNNKRVLLLSLTAGGVGLNLNVANHLLLIDIHWNPQLERQAQDRIYRYGQNKPTFIYRFMCKETVEQRIKALQDYKLEIANVVLNLEHGKASGGNGLTLKDLKKLFGM
ncbi:transcription termination factor 2 [Drosophila busckii]|uniref:transcription termination factor 2 n=1 Tax=Drosophila busckii TaxID=30019 RepID=UPI00083EF4E2|nr:transcription termination factor 2 [Drosophila busckii]